MNNGERLAALREIVAQKAGAYLMEFTKNGEAATPVQARLKQEWDKAEADLMAFLLQMKTQKAQAPPKDQHTPRSFYPFR